MKAVCESMMNYEEFKDYIRERISEFYMEGVSVSVISVNKNNDVKKDGLVMRSSEDIACPTIYINDFYKMYMDGRGINDVIREIIEINETSKLRNPFDAGFYTDFDRVKNMVVYKLVSRDRNENLLKEVPHREYLDLAVVYVCLIRDSEFGTASTLIRNEHLDMWDKNEGDLHRLAVENTPKLMPSSVRNMKDIIGGLFNCDEEANVLQQMYVLSNLSTVNGATCILYDDVLEKVGEKFKDNFYVIPSSIHEVILVPDEGDTCGESLAEILHMVNETELSPEEVLSDSIYYFNVEKKELEISIN